MIYLDTSALVKLVRLERESTDLADWLDERTELRWITSTLAEVELPRALIRAGHLAGLAAVPAVLARLDRFEIDSVVRATAAAFQDPALRSLDAIHLATADVAASVATLTAFVTYDSRLSGAAHALSMPTAAPGTN
ncbi:type II toxin-antitoxin system VapC family toxin [Mycobacterium sp. CVI_P3]|uniref:Ribonuclease VapC n=1 Tax=Mycobacterium pinniadriaticum TaxID=2994102 RepID=A0ABT3S8C7_9MYCO|nr:type II toxin-antitoxin system VapC family toxin [Mycobacterium pinniadriaticum]MCX2929327.1 type II toxin-antitoxin system VapC family toxin [Mycobacterium pinniadriaticum]MCX2935751.1 type II toxin-antitoxin system VapC family toxin [Mycobacterium pinniadriaticum]